MSHSLQPGNGEGGGARSDSFSRPMAEQSRPKVIYVMGAGRSGSTVLGVALGNCENVFFAGELDKWLVRRGAPNLTDDERTRFWSGVRGQGDGAAPVGGQ